MVNAALAALLVLAGAAGLFAVIIKLSRSMLVTKEEALVTGLTSGGATLKATKEGGLYEGNDVLLELDGRELFVNAKYVSRNFIRANVLVRTGFLPWAMFSRERGLHRLGKSLGINREVQTGDAAFDQRCYIDSPEPEDVVKRLLADATARQAILGLLDLGYHVQTSTRGVEAFRIVSAMGGLTDVKSAEVARLLFQLAGAVPGFGGLAFKTPRAISNVPLAALVVVLTVGGFLGTIALEGTLGVTLDRFAVLALVVGCGLGTWAAAVALLSILARGSSSGMQALLLSAIVMLFGVPAFGATLAVALNQRLDDGAPATWQVKVLSKRTSGDRHRVAVEHWETAGRQLWLDATCETFDALTVGGPATVKVHPGALGLPWAERL